MRGLQFGLAVAVAFGLNLSSRAQDTKPAEKKEIAWAKSYKDALEQSRKTGKLIMVDFYTDWCGWCKVLDKETYTSVPVKDVADKSFISLKINAEKEGVALNKRYAINGYPTILFLDGSKAPDAGKEDGKAGEGEVAGKIVGFMPGEPFADKMTAIDAANKEFPNLVARVDKDGSDLEALGKLAVAYHDRGNPKKAEETLKQADQLDAKNAKGLLTKAYNAVGDDYQEAQDFNKAIALFRKAAETGGKDVNAVVYALQSLASCYMSQGKAAQAQAELESVLKLEGLSKGDRDQTMQLLEQIKQSAKGR
ncbi:MAG: thioredoxin family protein [Isosphaeraceae bacterium]